MLGPLKTRSILVNVLTPFVLLACVACNNGGFSFRRASLSDLLGEGIDPAQPLSSEIESFDPDTDEPEATYGSEGNRDTFTQGYADKVDIVWVIDDSGSMVDNQNLLADNSPAFTQRLEKAVEQGSDFRLIVVTTSATSPKCNDFLKSQCTKYAPDGILTPATWQYFDDCVKDFAKLDGDCEQEEGIEASRRALDPKFSPVFNPQFLRSDANLEVVYVSDEEDYHAWYDWKVGDKALDGVPVTQDMIDRLEKEMSTPDLQDGRKRDGYETYFPLLENHLTFFKSLKSTTGTSFHAHAIVGHESTLASCKAKEVGKRYIDFAKMTGGHVSDICGKWDDTLDAIGLKTAGLKSCFPLSVSPKDPASIKVFVNNLEVPPSSYSYHAVSNQICFSTSPLVGTYIYIDYL